MSDFFSHRLEVLDGHLPLVYDTEVLDLSMKLTESVELISVVRIILIPNCWRRETNAQQVNRQITNNI